MSEILDKIMGLQDKLTVGGLDINEDDVLNAMAQQDESLNKLKTYISTKISETGEVIEEKIEVQKDLLNKTIDEWKENKKSFVKGKIIKIKSAYNELKKEVDALPSEITSAVTQFSMPTCIGTVAPNPARIAMDLIASANQFKSIIESLKTKTVNLLGECADICFIPVAIENLIEVIGGLEGQVDEKMGDSIAEAQAEQAKQEAIEEKLRRPIPGETLEASTTTGTEQTLQIKEII